MKLKQLIFILFMPFLGYSQMNSSIDLIGGLEYANRVLYGSGDSGLSSILIETRKGEVGKLGYRFGVNYNKRLSEKLILKTGIRFLQTGYKSEKTKLRWPSEQVGGVYTPDPSLPHASQFTYNFSFLELPIALRWGKPGDKFQLFFEAGLAPTLYLSGKTVHNLELDITEMESGIADLLTKVQLVGLLSVGVNYNLSDNTQIFIQPILRGHITQLIYNVGVKEHLVNAGIELGIRKRIN